MGIEIKTGRERNEGRDGGWKKTRMKSGLFLENKKRGRGEVADLAPWRIFSIFSGYIAFVKKAVLPFRGTEVRREDIYIYIYILWVRSEWRDVGIKCKLRMLARNCSVNRSFNQ